MPAVGLGRGVAEREEAVVQQHHADGPVVGLGRPHLAHQLGEVEPGHDVGDRHHVVAVDVAHDVGAVAHVGEVHDHVGVAVLDRSVRKERMQQGLDRRVRRARIELRRAELAHHVGVAQPIDGCQVADPVEAERRQTAGLDGGHVPTRALDVDRVDGPAR